MGEREKVKKGGGGGRATSKQQQPAFDGVKLDPLPSPFSPTPASLKFLAKLSSFASIITSLTLPLSHFSHLFPALLASLDTLAVLPPPTELNTSEEEQHVFSQRLGGLLVEQNLR